MVAATAEAMAVDVAIDFHKDTMTYPREGALLCTFFFYKKVIFFLHI